MSEDLHDGSLWNPGHRQRAGYIVPEVVESQIGNAEVLCQSVEGE